MGTQALPDAEFSNCPKCTCSSQSSQVNALRGGEFGEVIRSQTQP